MEFNLKSTDPAKLRTGCLLLGVLDDKRLSAPAEAVDAACGGRLARVLERGDLGPDPGASLLLHDVEGVAAERVMLVACGKTAELDAARFGLLIGRAAAALDGTGARDALLTLTALEVPGRDAYWRVRQAVERTEEALYRFDRLKSEKPPRERALAKIGLYLPDAGERRAAQPAVGHGAAVAGGVALARDLGNLPGNVCTPGYLADQAKALAAKHPKMSFKALTPANMEKLGMGALLAVARGSREPARLIILEYKGGPKSAKPVALVGKGVTFDSGGISIKPAAAMDEMKFDMCGAASVLGTMQAIAEMGLALNVVGLVPATENLPDGNAIKPGDIVTSLSGQTIEILNTDAEGRLILCDTLTYAQRYEPELTVDMATLTGAIVVALGSPASGLFSNDQDLVDALLAAGETSGDRAWRMPLWEADYQDQLKSNFADMANVGGRDAGAITAACFLARFTKGQRWAHLDIAASAWKQGKEKGATGRPVPLLTQFLLDRAGTGRG